MKFKIITTSNWFKRRDPIKVLKELGFEINLLDQFQGRKRFNDHDYFYSLNEDVEVYKELETLEDFKTLITYLDTYFSRVNIFFEDDYEGNYTPTIELKIRNV